MDRTVEVFAQRLTHMRERRRLTLQELATAAQTTYQSVWRIESKHAEPGIVLAVRLARALGCSLDYLCGVHDDVQDRWAPGRVDAWRQTLPDGRMHLQIAP